MSGRNTGAQRNARNTGAQRNARNTGARMIQGVLNG